MPSEFLTVNKRGYVLHVCYHGDVTTFRLNGYKCRRKTLRRDRQWLYDHAVKFASWQHPAMGSGVRFTVPIITCFHTDHTALYTMCSDLKGSRVHNRLTLRRGDNDENGPEQEYLHCDKKLAHLLFDFHVIPHVFSTQRTMSVNNRLRRSHSVDDTSGLTPNLNRSPY